MKPLYIFKIGGSVATYKNRPGFSVRRTLLKKVARAIMSAQKKEDFDLIIIHGAGSAGHQIAHKYGLKDGVRGNSKKMAASLQSRVLNQKLNNVISEIFVSEGLSVVSVHTASVIIQKNKQIFKCNTETIEESLKQNCIPILYGEMVFDESFGMTVCSGDAIAPFLAEKLKAQKIFFASDIDGIFDRDPYLYRDAKLIEEISLSEIENNSKVKLTSSHNIDVTGGLLGKIKNIDFKNTPSLQSVEIFNGLKEKNYTDILTEKIFPHSRIYI